MPNYVDIDNRDTDEMTRYHEAAIAALRRKVKELEAENELLRLSLELQRPDQSMMTVTTA